MRSSSTSFAAALVILTAVAQTGLWAGPPFTDADWEGIGGAIPGVNGGVDAMVRDPTGNLYVGGDFTVAGETQAAYIAMWNGTAWVDVGGGMDGTVYGLTLDRFDNLYVGGEFSLAGGKVSSSVAYVAAPPQAAGMVVAGSEATIAWTNLVPGRNYSALCGPDLTTSTWTAVGSAWTATARGVTLPAPATNRPAGFFGLRRE